MLDSALKQLAKERVHSGMQISQYKKGILVILWISFICFCLFYFSGQKGCGNTILAARGALAHHL